MGTAHLSSREAWKEKLTWGWRETCSASREGGAKEERNGCRGQKHSSVLLAPLTLRKEGLGPSQCRCEHSSHQLENWALEAGAASCSVIGSNAFQVKAEPSIPTLAPLSQQCTWPPTAILLPPTLCSFPCNLLVTSLIKFDRVARLGLQTDQWSEPVSGSAARGLMRVPEGAACLGFFRNGRQFKNLQAFKVLGK